MSWVMAYIGSVPDAERDAYEAATRRIAELFKDHGATRVVECWGADVPEGKLTSFPMAVKVEPGETVVMGWQEWPDRAAQEAGMKAAMEDPRMQEAMQATPIDGKRMIFAGFDRILDI
ncbi:DUF1428 domain-containing protein [Roseivivax sp. CAU 1761]